MRSILALTFLMLMSSLAHAGNYALVVLGKDDVKSASFRELSRSLEYVDDKNISPDDQLIRALWKDAPDGKVCEAQVSKTYAGKYIVSSSDYEQQRSCRIDRSFVYGMVVNGYLIKGKFTDGQLYREVDGKKHRRASASNRELDVFKMSPSSNLEWYKRKLQEILYDVNKGTIFHWPENSAGFEFDAGQTANSRDGFYYTMQLRIEINTDTNEVVNWGVKKIAVVRTN